MNVMENIYVRLLIVVFVLVNAGYVVGFIKNIPLARVFAWLSVVAGFLVVDFLVTSETPLFRMAAIISISLFAMKNVVLVETYRGMCRLNYIQWLAFVLGWFGMRPALFEKLPSKPLPGIFPLIIKGVTRIFIGLCFLIITKAFYHYRDPLTDTFGFTILIIPVFTGLVGLSFILHFGILNLSTASWRFSGVDCRELFKSPAVSKSLKEFWGKRWNMAFSEMTALAVYKPLKKISGNTLAMITAFLFSGILHELAISVPVKTGYGLPMLYFCIHGVLMQLESRWQPVQKVTLHPFWSRCWVMFWLVVPMPLLFHKEFIFNVVYPLIKLITDIIPV